VLIDDSSDYKRGGVVGGFYWFSPPSERVENSRGFLEILVEKSRD